MNTTATHFMRATTWRGLIAALVLLLAPAILHAEQKSPLDPANFTVMSQSQVVAADNPLASAVGAAILERGGSAADAGVATLLTLGVVHPFASGIGGGGFCLYRDAATQKVEAIDFRETAPAKASHDMYLVKGKADSGLSRYGGLAVATPGEAAGLWSLHDRHGTLDWAEVVDPAYELAQNGFYAGELLPKRLAQKSSKLDDLPEFVAAFKSPSKPEGYVEPFELLRRQDLARTLKAYRDRGPEAFYTGEIAEAIVAATTRSGGVLSLSDMKGYKPTWREPLQGTYRDEYELYTMPSPSSGGIVTLMVLNILEGFDLKKLGYGGQSVHLIIEAMKHAFADRAQWMGDSDFVKVPVKPLISKSYAKKRRALIDLDKTLKTSAYGSTKPPKDDDGTTHISVLDAAGNMLACTSTVNTSFGSLVYVPEWGIILNNEMDDFSAQPGVPNAFGLVGNEQNAIAPGKRPLSSMSPTLVTRANKPFMMVGGSGGPTIISGTIMAIIRTIDFAQDPSSTIAAARLHHQWLPPKAFFEGSEDGKLEQELQSKGHDVSVRSSYNSVQMIVVQEDGSIVGVSDPRKMGRPASSTPINEETP